MDAGLLAIFLLCSVVLASLLALGWLINLLAKRPLFNGAAVFFWLLLATIVGLLIYQGTLPHVTERMARYAGRSVGTVLPLLALAFYLARRFRRRNKATIGVARSADA